MAGRPFIPDDDEDPVAGVTGGFDQALRDPRAATALLQAGVSLMGGRQWGETGPNILARGIGSAGEAVARSDEQTRKDEEATSRQEARSAQADAATARAGAAQTAAQAAQDRVGVARDRLTVDQDRYQHASNLAEQKFRANLAIAQGRLDNARDEHERKLAQDEVDKVYKERHSDQEEIRTQYLGDRTNLIRGEGERKDKTSRLQADLRVGIQYSKDKDAIIKRNADRAKKRSIGMGGNDPDEPVPNFEEWKQKNGFGNVGGNPPVAPTSGKPAPPAAGTKKNGFTFNGGDPADPANWTKD